MLKTVSSIANAIGALNYKGTWDANANSPVLASSVGTKGDYYVVGTAGTTALNGISNWGIGDWAVFNGSVWQRVEGGADLNGVNLSVTGTSQLTGDVTLSNNLVQGTAAKGVNFTANANALGMTSELLNWYEEGTWTPVVVGTSTAGAGTYGTQVGRYTRIGRAVSFTLTLAWSAHTGTGSMYISGLPFTSSATGSYAFAIACYNLTFSGQLSCYMIASSTNIFPISIATAAPYALLALDSAVTELEISGTYFV